MDEKPKGRWFRFSLRTQFVLLTLFCVWLGWQVHLIRERRALRADLATRHITITIDNDKLPWWRRWLGDEGIGTIETLSTNSFDNLLTESESDRIHRTLPEATVTATHFD